MVLNFVPGRRADLTTPDENRLALSKAWNLQAVRKFFNCYCAQASALDRSAETLHAFLKLARVDARETPAYTRFGRAVREAMRCAAIRSLPTMTKPKIEWTKKGEPSDFDAARTFLSLLYSDTKANALVESLRNATLVEHAAKDLLRAAQLSLLPRDEPHVDDDLKRIHKGKPLPPILLIQGDMTKGLPLVVADGYHRICAICYFDESAPIPCRMASIGR
jgi:hypothetical protein